MAVRLAATTGSSRVAGPWPMHFVCTLCISVLKDPPDYDCESRFDFAPKVGHNLAFIKDLVHIRI